MGISAKKFDKKNNPVHLEEKSQARAQMEADVIKQIQQSVSLPAIPGLTTADKGQVPQPPKQLLDVWINNAEPSVDDIKA